MLSCCGRVWLLIHERNGGRQLAARAVHMRLRQPCSSAVWDVSWNRPDSRLHCRKAVALYASGLTSDDCRCVAVASGGMAFLHRRTIDDLGDGTVQHLITTRHPILLS